MASDYAAIRNQHLDDYGRKSSWRQAVLADKYSERTHFLFELFQNAEDAGATRVELVLDQDRLAVRHDGADFTPQDVRAICAIGETTKADDAASIGRFGIGFKSVYAYTTTPQVHCPGTAEHFEIRAFIEPWPVEPRDPGPRWTTLFLFPFDRPEVAPSVAVQEIADRLATLSPQTVLFLQNLQSLEWRLAGRGGARLRRDQAVEAGARRVRVHGDLPTGHADQAWLLFDRPVQLVDGRPPNRVEAAFQVVTDQDGVVRVKPLYDNELVAFFPTSRRAELGFLLQAPFVPTPARDNIRDDHPVNQRLAGEAAGLLVDTLDRLRDRGLLDVTVLQCLPLDVSAFPPGSLLRPLYEAVRQAMLDRPLLPTADGRYLPATQVRLARGAALRPLLSPEQLGALLGLPHPLAWASPELSEDRTRTLYRYLAGYRPYSERYGEQEVTALVPGFDVDLNSVLARLTENFLSDQDDAWVIALYRLLEEQRTSPRELRRRPIIRRADGTHVPAFDEGNRPQIWLPPAGESSFPTVPSAIAADEGARRFLGWLGLTEPDLGDDVIATVLPRYVDRIEVGDGYRQDLARIARALAEASGGKRDRLLCELQDLRFLLGRNAATGERRPMAAGGLYEPTPELECLHTGNEEIWFLDQQCLEHRDRWQEVGVRAEITSELREPTGDGHVPIRDYHGYHERGRDGFDPEFRIEGLDYALQHPSPERSLLIWETLSSLGRPLRGRIECSTRQNYAYSSLSDAVSPVWEATTSHTWLRDRSGRWRRPGELSLDELDDAYRRDDVLARRLGMHPTSRQDLAEALGLDPELTDELFRDREQLRKFLRDKRERRQGEPPGGPRGPVPAPANGPPPPLDPQVELSKAFNSPEGGTPADPDPDPDPGSPEPIDVDRRRAGQEREVRGRQGREPDPSERQRPVQRTEWESPDEAVREFLRHEYGGRCQICQATFQRRDGEPYFEAKYLIPRTAARWVDHSGNALCLCPTCFAKFLHGAVKGPEVVHQLKASDPASADGAAIEFCLCGERVQLRITPGHLVDIQTLLKSLGSAPTMDQAE